MYHPASDRGCWHVVIATVTGFIAFGSIQATSLADRPAASPVAPALVGLDAAKLNQIDSEVEGSIEQQKLPGAVVAIGFRGQLVFLRAYGHRQLVPEAEKMTTDTVFDLASLTKPIVTACCLMKLVDRGDVDIEDPVSKHIPEFAINGKQAVTIKQLLLHTAGLIPDNSLGDYALSREQSIRNVMELSFNYPPGERFRYSDVGFIVLGRLIEIKSGKELASFAEETLFSPLAMTDTGFCPETARRLRAASTEQRDGQWLKGEVHDPRAFALGGVAGHAGLFSTATDLAVFSQMLLSGGEFNGQQILSSQSIDAMTAANQVPSGIRGLGWDKQSAYSSNRGASMSEQAFGHGGFTGTGLWIDPELELYVIFLSNRVHPNGSGAVNPLIGRIGTIAADAAIAALKKPVDSTQR